MAARHVFVQVASGPDLVEERAALDRGPAKTRNLVRPWASAPRGVAAAIKRWIGHALRVAGLVLFVSPLLAAGRFVLGSIAPSIADWLVVIFVLLVCLFFALLNLYVLASVAAWIVRNRPRLPHLVPPRRPRPELAIGDATERSSPNERVTARGIAVRLEPAAEGGPLVSDAWSQTERRTEADDFAIRRAGTAIPVVVRLETAPLLLGATEVRDGDEVTVIGRVREIATSTDRIDLGGETRALARIRDDGIEDAPYRSAPAGPAVVIGDTSDAPVTILVVARRPS